MTEQWAINYANSMKARQVAWEASKPRAQERARAQRNVAKANRADSLKNRRCAVPGCAYVWHKGRLCRKHWDTVPQSDRMTIAIDSILAARRAAEKGHRRVERELLARLKADG